MALLSEAPSDGKSPGRRRSDGETPPYGEQMALRWLPDNGDLDDVSRINVALSAPVARALSVRGWRPTSPRRRPCRSGSTGSEQPSGPGTNCSPVASGACGGPPLRSPPGRLGFDVLYIPPVHPIGHRFRKGKKIRW